MAFLTEAEPQRGVATPIRAGVRRLVAPNPGPMTYHGTNTFLIDPPPSGNTDSGSAGVIVLDPGPDSAEHVAATLDAAAGKVSLILLSHTHADHLGATAALRAATGAPVAAFHTPMVPEFIPDIRLEHGAEIAGFHALHTPGHAADHLCFAWREGVLFSADHVMAWSTSIVSPPGGDMAAYFASLRLLLERRDTLYLPGHGPALDDPHPYVRDLLAHRMARENAIASMLARGPASTERLMETLYSQLNPMLRRAAERNVLAHLLKLENEGRVRRVADVWQAAA